MAKDLENTILFDVYGSLLTEKQRETLEYYYNDDLSLGEISEETGITRQGVMNCIKTSEARRVKWRNQTLLSYSADERHMPQIHIKL